MELSHRQARELLKRLNEEVGGTLLRTTGGKKPEYTFFPAVLAKAKPEVFERLESLEEKVENLLEWREEQDGRTKRIVAQTGQNTRDIARIRSRERAA